VAIVAVGRGRSPLNALLVPLFAAFDALLDAVGGDIERCPLVATLGHLHASLSRVKHDRLIIGGVLGGDAARLLERVPEEVVVSVLARVPHAALWQHTHATLVSLTVSHGLNTLALPP
jgi:hypothetical protein